MLPLRFDLLLVKRVNDAMRYVYVCICLTFKTWLFFDFVLIKLHKILHVFSIVGLCLLFLIHYVFLLFQEASPQVCCVVSRQLP